MKKTLFLLLGVLLTLNSWAEGQSGYCGRDGDGSNVTWTLSDEGVLTLSGTGEMKASLTSWIMTVDIQYLRTRV